MSIEINNVRDLRIGTFLMQYLTANEGDEYLYMPEIQKEAIKKLIEDGVMTADEIREEAVRDYYVVIPADYFPEGDE